MKKHIQPFLVLSVFLFLFSCNLTDNLDNKLIKIEFKEINADSLRFMDPSISHARPKKEGHFLEKIKKYPDNYKLLSTFQFDMQHYKELSDLFVKDSSFRKEITENFSINQIDFITKLAKITSFDCIISACEVQDESGIKYFVFDSNNDEDLSNDRVIKFKEFENLFINQEKNLSYQMAESIVEVEIYDGEKISNKKLLLSFVKKISGKSEISFLSNRNIKFGFVNINDKTYQTIIRNMLPNVNYNRYDFLWIDLNQNHKFDSDADFYEQMLFPFTLFGSSYRVNDIAVFGDSVYLEKLNSSQFPPIDVGLSAPDFQFTLNDSTDFKLSNYKGNYVLLDFWLCNPFYCNSISTELSNKYKDNKNLKIISCALDSTSFSSFKQRSHLNNENGNRVFLTGSDIKKVRSLYQQTSVNKLILIGPDLKIINIEKFISKETEKLLSELL